MVVFAFEQRVNEDGQQFGGPGFNVSLFDVTILDVEPFFIAEEIGFGFSEDAAVKINGSLSKGVASAQDVPLCDNVPCAPGAPESISVAVEWAGFGPTESFKAHDKFSDPFCFINARSRGSLRSANASGTVDGMPLSCRTCPTSGRRCRVTRSGRSSAAASPDRAVRRRLEPTGRTGVISPSSGGVRHRA